MSTDVDVYLPTVTVVDATDTIIALDLQGEFDFNDADTIADHARRALESHRHLIVNLSDVTFIDSSIVHALFKAQAAAEDAGRRFVLQFGTHAIVERVLSITEADTKFVTAPSRSEAIRLIEQP
jgi:anti-anti-sigma factor